MNQKLDEILFNFSIIQWHDSKILSIQFLPIQNSMACKITMDLHLPHKFDIGEVKTNHCRVIYDDCSYWGCSLDLFYLMWSRMSIDKAKFYKTLSEIDDKYLIQKMDKYFELDKKYEDEMWFLISLMSPGGEIIISARNLEIKGLTEVS